MVRAIRQEITVKKDNVVEIHSSALKAGKHIEVILLFEEESKPKQKSNLRKLIGKGKGSFATSKEADAFIRSEIKDAVFSI